jgi:hypothetical protein
MMNRYFKWALGLTIVPVALVTLFSFSNSPDGYEPVLMTRKNMEAAVQIRESREIEKPGKIWVYDQYIFVIEQYKGIHIIDNTNPSNPENVAFVQVDGCTDVAVKEGLIYANNAVDLIGIKTDLANNTIEVLSRNRGVLPELLSPDGSYPYGFQKYRPQNSIIVRYESYKN